MLPRSHNYNPELWGGLECTINRIDNSFRDQLLFSGHYDRKEDLQAIIKLGIKKLRFPILWELHQPTEETIINWSRVNTQLQELIDNGVTPIAGLLHHGSGPHFTHLLDPSFPDKIANYAGGVAKRFPWLEYYTPVNEPLTTARFSGLYGFWYPHKQSDTSFVKMLINQVKGIVLSMRAIRKVNPSAKLVQTEDLGKTYSVQSLAYQANFENERRWLTYDLLCGKVNKYHPMWGYFSRLGIKEEALNFFIQNPCPPDIMGFNHYVTSERYLDDNLKKYPSFAHGGNELQEYADVEAVRVKGLARLGLKNLLHEAWERFKVPMAITEVHLNCTREDQLRWFHEVWNGCAELNAEGVVVLAVTAWSIFGAYGWNSLLTSEKMEYEPGAFDLRGGSPRPTALSKLISSIGNGSFNYHHPVLDQMGWWHREIRYRLSHTDHSKIQGEDIKPVLIIGKKGTLGNAFARCCNSRAISNILVGREEVDITRADQIEGMIIKHQPWAIVNGAGYVNVDGAEQESTRCINENTVGAKLLASACQKYGVKLITFSSDLVFDGSKKTGYTEDDQTNPLNRYGASKVAAELAVMEENPLSLIIRSSAFFGPWDKYNYVHSVIKNLSSGNSFIAAEDIHVSPTYIPDLVNVSLDLLIDDEKGIWHLSNDGSVTWVELAKDVAMRAGLDSDLVIPMPAESMGYLAERPAFSVLKSRYGILLPSLDNALDRYFDERKEPELVLKNRVEN